MKVYFVYIHNLPSETYRKMDGTVFLPKLELNEDNMTYYGLYAITNNKKLLEEFMSIHNKKYFFISKKKLTKEEYHFIKKEKLGYFINYNKYRIDKNKFYKLPTTNDEHMHATEDCEDMVFNYMEDAYQYLVKDLPFFDYRMYNDEYRDLLEKIYFGTFFDLMSGDESKDDVAGYNMGYELTSDGNYHMSYEYNTFEVFIEIYSPILQK